MDRIPNPLSKDKKKKNYQSNQLEKFSSFVITLFVFKVILFKIKFYKSVIVLKENET